MSLYREHILCKIICQGNVRFCYKKETSWSNVEASPQLARPGATCLEHSAVALKFGSGSLKTQALQARSGPGIMEL